MIEIKTLHFRLRLEYKIANANNPQAYYFITFFGESAFDVNKNFLETILIGSDDLPFYSMDDAARYAEEQAAYWKWLLMANEKLKITNVGELQEAWQQFATQLHSSFRGYFNSSVRVF